MSERTRAQQLAQAIRSPKHPGRPAVMPYVTSGYPTMEGFGSLLQGIGALADAIEVGVPFSDPMADGPVIQQSSRVALDSGVTLTWILETLRGLQTPPAAPMVLMSYLNPLMAYGLENVVRDAFDAGISGFIVPDLPWEEGAEFRGLVAAQGMASIQLVTPVTPQDRLEHLVSGDDGFVYAVTVTGITGAAMDPAQVSAYLDRVRASTRQPVCAGFGIRSAAHIKALHGHADGAIVGSALIDCIRKGEDPIEFVRALVED
jgi:tryptophan synthase alpha chain